MKKLHRLVIIPLILTLFVFGMCSEEKNPEIDPVNKVNFDTLTFSHSMKGWELYSWPKGNDWRYSILPGTNRVKSYGEVTSNLIVCGKDSLKMLLNKFPEGENIFWLSEEWLKKSWSTSYGNLSLPADNIVTEIKDYCTQKKLVLNISN